jgi:two-component system CheB/CheR fusion protein
LQEALRAGRDQLEHVVRQRTKQLTKANRSLQEEINERKRLERKILQVSAQEQQRIGQDLHDGVGQELTGLNYLAQSLYQSLQAQGSAEAETASELAGSLARAIGHIRRTVRGLIPVEVDAKDLESALEVLAAQVKRQTGIACRFQGNGDVQIHDDDSAIQIYRITQEAVTNAVKHAHARQIIVTLKADGNELCLEVRDDGVGIRSGSQLVAGCGLRSMKYRARVLGGTCEIRAMPHGGTRVSCVIPQNPCSGRGAEGMDQ